jgi:hypothetical protein
MWKVGHMGNFERAKFVHERLSQRLTVECMSDLSREIDERFTSVLGTLWRRSRDIPLPKTMALLDELLDERSAANTSGTVEHPAR